MARWRRPGADEILLVFLLLAAIGFILSWLSHSYSPLERDPWSFFVTVFLVWRVSRGGRISRVLLIIDSGGSCAVAALAVARMWDVAVVALVVIGAAQIALLVSPPVYGRTRRPVPIAVRARGWAQLVRRPPAWLLPWGLLAGALVTLACLGSGTFVNDPGCASAAFHACGALVEGYPLRWLTAYQDAPVISKGALVKDSVQWVLVSMSVLYLGWLWLTAPADSSE